MFRRQHVFLLLSIVFIFMLAFSSGCTRSNEAPRTSTANPAQTEGPIDFEDPVFFNLLKKELGKEEIYPKDLAGFTSIKITADEFIFLAVSGGSEKSIIHFNENAFEYDGVRYEGFGTMKSLADLKYFTSLDKIYISLQPEIDYSTIPEEIAKKVRSVLVYQSRLEDISFLEKFENLMVLTLNTNNISDLRPLEGKDKILRLSFDWSEWRYGTCLKPA